MKQKPPTLKGRSQEQGSRGQATQRKGPPPLRPNLTALEQVVSRIENVRSTVNELGVMAPTSIGARSQDTVLTSKVKATLVDARDLQANVFKVITERSVVYLMGRVTEREANRFADVARSVNGVRKVVKVFEQISEAELAALAPRN